jgi:uncharacterized membrane protein (DUF485 family)
MNPEINNEEYYDRYMSDLLINIFRLTRLTLVVLLVYFSFITLVEFKKHSDIFEDCLIPITKSYYKIIAVLDSGFYNLLLNIGN